MSSVEVERLCLTVSWCIKNPLLSAFISIGGVGLRKEAVPFTTAFLDVFESLQGD